MPVKRNERLVPPAKGSADGAPHQPSTTILVVDDDAVIREMLQYMLLTSGFEVDVATDGFDALEMAAARRYDVAVIDYMMPGMSGIDVARNLAASGPRPATVLISGGIVPDERPAIDAYLRKPFETDALVDVINRLIRT